MILLFILINYYLVIFIIVIHLMYSVSFTLLMMIESFLNENLYSNNSDLLNTTEVDVK